MFYKHCYSYTVQSTVVDEGWLAETAQIVPSHAHATVAQIQLLRAMLSLRELLLLN